jgi:hypothetical protein
MKQDKGEYQVGVGGIGGSKYFWWTRFTKANGSMTLYHHAQCPHMCVQGSVEKCCLCAGSLAVTTCPICRLGGKP